MPAACFQPCLECRDNPDGPLCRGADGRRDLARIARGYLRQGHPEAIDHDIAFDCAFSMLHDDIDTTLAFIFTASDLCENDEQRAYLGAGTLESLLVNAGPAVIDRVLDRARRDPAFRRVLSGVWGHSAMDKTVRARIDALLAPPVFKTPAPKPGQRNRPHRRR
ncbi:DUF6869 domain-containing protein [Phreatobacter sp. HK31-P]